ncbi:4-galactosyl-N-acetylglucosaminide 3-alpha-L-fucosyltransferase FUT6-like [Clavelina lepadiformis]|uniref:4-galactosyl-N-acetylglucosaminide 3-alpha-L-fucosyltransferase FUT6-like n=1 Tax=Clavelina lepadiformis TaxID=159417 RepID=UPI004040F45F
MVDRTVLSKILIVLIVLVTSSTYLCYNFLSTITFNTFSKSHQVLLRWPKRLTSSTNQYEPFNDIQIPATTKTASNQGTSTDVDLIKIRANLSQKLDEVLQNSTQQRFSIIIWEPPFGAKSTIHLDQSKCGACDVSYDQGKVHDPMTKAVVFHFNELRLNKMPHTRRLDQYYVWWSMEGPPALRELRGMKLSEYDNVFNLTMTYRRDSDIYNPYSTAADVLLNIQSSGSGDPDKDLDQLISKKKAMVIWMVSNCGATKGAQTRMKLVQDLINAGLPVDRRGGCFPKNKPAPRGQQLEIISEFKFYFAFENSYHCLDYITEKLSFNAFGGGAVPVVFGAKKSDYQAVVPPNSCIYVDDFANLQNLVNYLKYLDKNVTAYKEYMKWRTMKPEEMPNYGRSTSLCQLCRVLHGINVDNLFNPFYSERYSSIPLFGHPSTPRVVTSLREWFYGTLSKNCLANY